MKQVTLSEQIYLKLREKLLDMEFGEHLSIRQCARAFDTSYTPVREAFLRLETEGLLRRIPSVGYFVIGSSANDLLELYQVRKCIESYTLIEQFDSITEDDIGQMSQICQEHEIASRQKRWDDAINLDITFHSYLIRKYQNKTLCEVYAKNRQQYNDYFIKKLYTLFTMMEGGMENLNATHVPFLQAIEQKDLALALELQKKHIMEGFCQISHGLPCDDDRTVFRL